MSENTHPTGERPPVKFAPEKLLEQQRQLDTAGGDTLRVAPINPSPDAVKEIRHEGFVDARLAPELKPESPEKRSKFAPITVDFALPSGSGNVRVRRIALREEALFRTLAHQMMQFTPHIDSMSMRGILSMYDVISETITKMVISCVSGADVNSLPLCDKLALFYKIVALTYGPKHLVRVDTDDAPHTMGWIDFDSLKIVGARPEQLQTKVTLPRTFAGDSYAIVVPPTIKDEPVFYTDDIFSQLRCIIKSMVVEGETLTVEEIHEAITVLHPEDVHDMEAAMESYNKFGVDINTLADVGTLEEPRLVDFDLTIETVITDIVNKNGGGKKLI